MHDANPYAGYDEVDTNPFLLDDWTLIDGRLSPKVRIVGVVIDGDEVAYPLPALAEVGVVNDSVGGQPLVVLWVPGTVSELGAPTVAGGEDVGTAVVYSREAEGDVLEFEATNDGAMRDTATGRPGRSTGTLSTDRWPASAWPRSQTISRSGLPGRSFVRTRPSGSRERRGFGAVSWIARILRRLGRSWSTTPRQATAREVTTRHVDARVAHPPTPTSCSPGRPPFV